MCVARTYISWVDLPPNTAVDQSIHQWTGLVGDWTGCVAARLVHSLTDIGPVDSPELSLSIVGPYLGASLNSDSFRQQTQGARLLTLVGQSMLPSDLPYLVIKNIMAEAIIGKVQFL
jgi:hypothetical protein